jgi:fatty-acyl-CoA synthase
MMFEPKARTLPALIDELAERMPDRPAVSFEGRTLTFSEFRREAIDFAKALIRDGVSPGDHIGILMGNCTEWLIANFGIQYACATMVALNTWYTPRELHYVLSHAEISTLISADRYAKANYLEIIEGFKDSEWDLSRIRRTIIRGNAGVPGSVSFADFANSARDLPDETVLRRSRAVRPEDIAYLLYTSGSTAHPKGVLLQHRGLIENTFNIGERLHFTPDDVFFMPISLFWGMGCENMLFTCWTHGVHIVLQDQFDPGEALQLIERYRCSATSGTPNIIHAIFNHPERPNYDISSMRKGTASGTPEATRQVIETCMPMACHCYGLTESYGFTTVNDASDPVDKRCQTEGRVLPGTILKIISPETNQEVPPGVAGEVRIKGYVMPAYYKNPDANAASFDENGFFRTGDLCSVDEDGYMTFRGRIKEMLKTGGMNVAPIEVEEVLRNHDAVADAFVTGLPDPVAGEIVAAAVILKPGARMTAEDVVAHCRASLASYKAPRQVRFVTLDMIPLTSTSKVHRMRLVELFAEQPA